MKTDTPETDALLETDWHHVDDDITDTHAYNRMIGLCRKMECERDTLAEWRRQSLQLSSWWDEIDAYVRKHPACIIGDFVAKTTLRLLEDGDALRNRIQALYDCMDPNGFFAKKIKAALDGKASIPPDQPKTPPCPECGKQMHAPRGHYECHCGVITSLEPKS